MRRDRGFAAIVAGAVLILLFCLAAMVGCGPRSIEAPVLPVAVATDTMLVCLPGYLPNGREALFCRPVEVVKQ